MDHGLYTGLLVDLDDTLPFDMLSNTTFLQRRPPDNSASHVEQDTQDDVEQYDRPEDIALTSSALSEIQPANTSMIMSKKPVIDTSHTVPVASNQASLGMAQTVSTAVNDASSS